MIALNLSASPSHRVIEAMKLLPTIIAAAGFLLFCAGAQARTDRLPSWRDGTAKARIVAFVKTVTDKKSKAFVPPAERVVVFDNDGTLWSEQPMY